MSESYTRRLIQSVFAVTGVVVILSLMWVARDALLLIYVSALLAMGISPLVRLLERPSSGPVKRFRMPRWLAILTIYLAVIVAMTIIGLLIIPPLITQASALWTKLPDELNRLQAFLIERGLTTKNLTLAEAVSQAPSGSGSDAVGTVLVAVSSVIGGVFALITVLILSFYLLIEAETMFDYLARFMPAARRNDVAEAAREAVAKVSAWLGAQLLLAGVMGTFAAIGLGLMGVPYFYVIALVAAVGETIPIIGPIIGGVTAVCVSISVSPKLAVIVGGYFLVLHQLESNVLVPKIMERRVGVSPVAVMVALLVGGSLRGLIGAILAIPTAAILSVILADFVGAQDSRIQRIKAL